MFFFCSTANGKEASHLRERRGCDKTLLLKDRGAHRGQCGVDCSNDVPVACAPAAASDAFEAVEKEDV